MKKATLLIAMIFFFSSYAYSIVCPNVPGDDTQCLRECLQEAKNSDKVAELYGDFIITGQIVVPQGVVLKGTGAYWGSTIKVTFGEELAYDDRSNGAIVIEKNVILDGLTFFYSYQTRSGPFKSYPPTVVIAQDSGFQSIKNCFFPNSYTAIDMTEAHGRVSIFMNQFGASFRGIRVNRCYDIDRISFNHFNYNIWEVDQSTWFWLYNNGVALEAARVDWLWVNNLFVFGYKYGIWLTSTESGTSGPVEITNVGFDMCQRGIFSNVESGPRPWLVSIVNSDFVAGNPSSFLSSNDGIGIELVGISQLTLRDNKFWGIRDKAIRLERCEKITVDSNKISNWNISGESNPAILLESCFSGAVYGNTISNATQGGSGRQGIVLDGSSNIIISLNSVDKAIRNGIVLKENTQGCIIFGNVGNIINKSSGNRTISDVPLDRYAIPVQGIVPKPSP